MRQSGAFYLILFTLCFDKVTEILHRDKAAYMTVYLASKYSLNSKFFKVLKVRIRIYTYI